MKCIFCTYIFAIILAFSSIYFACFGLFRVHISILLQSFFRALIPVSVDLLRIERYLYFHLYVYLDGNITLTSRHLCSSKSIVQCCVDTISLISSDRYLSFSSSLLSLSLSFSFFLLLSIYLSKRKYGVITWLKGSVIYY